VEKMKVGVKLGVGRKEVKERSVDGRGRAKRVFAEFLAAAAASSEMWGRSGPVTSGNQLTRV
jgi:hypothetical protein